MYVCIYLEKWSPSPAYLSIRHSNLPASLYVSKYGCMYAGGGSVVCFLTGDFELSKHIVTNTKLFKITVSFGSVNSLISVPGQMSHASIPAEVRSARYRKE